jgi:hypothetical protein
MVTEKLYALLNNNFYFSNEKASSIKGGAFLLKVFIDLTSISINLHKIIVL